jgi:hypothetical protein
MCVYSKSYEHGAYKFNKDTGRNVISNTPIVWDKDSYGYQASGCNSKITENSKYLCVGYFSTVPEQVESFVECDVDCENRTQSSSDSSSDSDRALVTVCNNKCDTEDCEDEANCNGLV